MSTATQEAPKQVAKQVQPAPDPELNPVRYLQFHGWRCQGDPKKKAARWLDPTKPRDGAETKEPVMVLGPEGKRIPFTKKKPDGTIEEVMQTHVEPPAWPMTRDEALAIQIDRDEVAAAKK